MKSVKPRVRAVARKLIEMAEGGDLQAIKEVGDRLDGKCTQDDRARRPPGGDRELLAIIRGGSPEPVDVPSYLRKP